MNVRPRVTGYAVVTADGAFVGIWREREIAEKICNRPPAKGERVVHMEEEHVAYYGDLYDEANWPEGVA